MTDNDVIITAAGLVYCTACAIESVVPKQIEISVNLQLPTGIHSEWRISKKAFNTGEPNPCVCDKDPNRRHWLLSC